MTVVPAVHTTARDCTIGPAHCCTGCGVDHSSACPLCGQTGFHREGCRGIPAEPLSPSVMAERFATGRVIAGNFVAGRIDYDDAEGYFLDHVVTGASPEQSDELMRVLDDAYGR